MGSGNGSIPVLSIEGPALAGVWEQSLLELEKKGCRVKTQYDNPDDPPSIDATMMMTVLNPYAEPFIHRCFPGSLGDLEEYRLEVVEGIKDSWVRDLNNPDDKRWEYTYHGRLTNYQALVRTTDHRGVVGADAVGINQLDAIVEGLARTPYSRRHNAVTWQPWNDIGISDPPCLQSIWCRILENEIGVWRLNMNVRFRSRDAYKAAYMNMFAFIRLQEHLAERIAEKAGREVKLGRYCDLSDSYHVNGKDFKGGAPNFYDGFLGMVKSRTFKERTWTREFAAPFFEERRQQLKAKGLLK